MDETSVDDNTHIRRTMKAIHAAQDAVLELQKRVPREDGDPVGELACSVSVRLDYAMAGLRTAADMVVNSPRTAFDEEWWKDEEEDRAAAELWEARRSAGRPSRAG